MFAAAAISSSISKAAPPDLVIATSDTDTKVSTVAVANLTNVPDGALLVMTTCITHTGPTNCTVTSAPSLVWTKQADAGGAAGDNCEIHTAVFTGGGKIDITSTWAAGNDHALVCYAVLNAEAALGGANGTQTGTSAPSVDVTTTRINSILFAITVDWNGVDGASRTLRDTATETLYYHPNGGITVYAYYKQCTTPILHTVGVSAPTGQVAATAVLEIRKVAA